MSTRDRWARKRYYGVCSICGGRTGDVYTTRCHRCWVASLWRGIYAEMEILTDRSAGPDACWPWLGPVAADGYARCGRAKAYALAYEMHVASIPQGLAVDHVCHSVDLACPGGPTCPHRRCVNPNHLGLVTPRENTIRGRSRSALNAAKTVCVNGHPFDEQNTYHWRGKRSCRTCTRESMRRYRAAARAAA